MRSVYGLSLSLCIAGCATALAPQDGATAISQTSPSREEDRIAAVEGGLIPPVVIKGAPLPGWTIEERMRFYNAAGLSIAVINNGRIEWAKGYGVKRNGSSDPVTPDTLFAAGSISKPVAAMAALRLVQEGKLDLNQNVNDRLTSWKAPENEFTTHEKVSLRRILNHTSGLSALGGDGLPTDEITIVQALKGEKPARNAPAQVEFTPGALQRYSNGAYGLLGLLLEDVSRVPTADIFRQTVLEPLGMANSLFTPVLPQSHWPRAATGHNSRTGEPGTLNEVNGPLLGASGLWSTPSNLAKFVIELQTAKTTGQGRVLSGETADLMLTPSRGIWSLGLQVDTKGRTPRFWHDGSVPGFTSYMVAYNWRGQGAVVMVNEDAYNGLKLVNEVMFAIARVYGWSDFGPIERTTVSAQPQLYAGYEGTYEIDEGYPITIVARRGKLYLIWALGAVFEMHPEGADSFFIVREGAPSYIFSRDASGAVAGVARRWNGGEGKAPRVSLPEASKGRTALTLAGHQDALIVSLVGTFNEWKLQKTICDRAPRGWACQVDLPPGEHSYAFLIDGRQIADPARGPTIKSPDGGPASTIRITR